MFVFQIQCVQRVLYKFTEGKSEDIEQYAANYHLGRWYSSISFCSQHVDLVSSVNPKFATPKEV